MLKVVLVEFRDIFVFKDLQIVIKYSGRELYKTSYSASSTFSACYAEACLRGSVQHYTDMNKPALIELSQVPKAEYPH